MYLQTAMAQCGRLVIRPFIFKTAVIRKLRNNIAVKHSIILEIPHDVSHQGGGGNQFLIFLTRGGGGYAISDFFIQGGGGV